MVPRTRTGGASWAHAMGAARIAVRPIIPSERASIVRNIASSLMVSSIRSGRQHLEHNPIGLNQYRKGRDSQTRSDRRVLPDRMIRGTSDAEGLFPGLA